MIHFITNIYSKYFSYFPKMPFPFMNSVKIYVQNNPINEKTNSLHTKRKKPNLTIDTNIDDKIVGYNYKKAIAKSSEGSNNVQYFRSYLKHFYSCEKSEEEIERILETIKQIRNSVKKDFETLSSLYKRRILDLLKYEKCFYKKSTSDFIVKLYKMNHNGKPAVVKMYLFYPEYLCTKYILEDRFETEVIFSIYAKKINEKCDFVSPDIYAFGSVSLFENECIEMKYLFIIMEFIEGISLKHSNFTPEVCTKIYEIKNKLSCELLSHNDLHPRNMMIDSSKNIVVLDYGESSYCI
jgi:thiamine kinase-like enzyme